jgi:hypothetical protein
MFSSWKSGELRWNLDIPWMTEAERGAFKTLRSTGGLSSFRITYCEGRPIKDGKPVRCANEIPRVTNDQGQQVKRYCSRRCHDSIENEAGDETS